MYLTRPYVPLCTLLYLFVLLCTSVYLIILCYTFLDLIKISFVYHISILCTLFHFCVPYFNFVYLISLFVSLQNKRSSLRSQCCKMRLFAWFSTTVNFLYCQIRFCHHFWPWSHWVIHSWKSSGIIWWSTGAELLLVLPDLLLTLLCSVV